MQSTARSWTFTSFANDIFPNGFDDVKYCVYQREITPTTGQEHWQGYIVYKSPCRMSKIKTILGDNAAHLEIAKGNAQQNHAYCTKQESRKPGTEPVEHGELPKLGQGKRESL